MTHNILQISLGEWLGSEDETIRRNAMSILKIAQRCDHKFETVVHLNFRPRWPLSAGIAANDSKCIYCFKRAE